jgi:hypothetical protein
MAIRFEGNCPTLVKRDAKYSVVYNTGSPERNMRVRLIYTVGPQLKALLTTNDHGPLVNMVNEVKEELSGFPGGVFYVNEHAQVLVPVNGAYYLAGTYSRFLEFDFQGTVIGPKILGDIKPGDPWPGPHCGIPYTLTADGRDIRYKIVTGMIEKTVLLSAEVGTAAAASLAKRLAKIKGPGGAVYINEAREFFAPVAKGCDYEYLYLGPLGTDPWFAMPTASTGS